MTLTHSVTQSRTTREPTAAEVYNRLVKASHALYAVDDGRIIAHIPLGTRMNTLSLNDLDRRYDYSRAGPAYLLVQDVSTIDFGRNFIQHGEAVLKIEGKVIRPYSGLKVVSNGERYTTTANNVRPVNLEDLASLNTPQQFALALHVTLPERRGRIGAEIKQRFESLYRGVFL